MHGRSKQAAARSVDSPSANGHVNLLLSMSESIATKITIY